jgi:condensin-2 complex subunit D3
MVQEEEDGATAAAALHETIRELLNGRSSSILDEDDDSMDETRQTRLCLRILHHFQHGQHHHQTQKQHQHPPNLEESSVSGGSDDVNDDDASNDDNDFLRTKRNPLLVSNKNSTKGNNNASINLREFLGDGLSSTRHVAQLTSILATLMSSRVEIEQCLPMTYDDEANYEAMHGGPCITLTRTALVAGALYASLAALPGALATGLVDMHALAALVALLKRWKLEMAHAPVAPVNKEASKPNKHGKRKDNDVDPPVKRPRRGRHADDDSEHEGWVEHDSSADDDDNDDDESITKALDQNQLQTMGLRIAQELAILPLQKEFMSWSSEAREAVIDATMSVLATSCALLAKNSNNKQTAAQRLAKTSNNNKNNNQLDLVSLAETTVSRASSALIKCIILEPSAMDDDDDDDDDDSDDDEGFVRSNIKKSSKAAASGSGSSSDCLTKRHDTTVFILRGILSAMTFREEQPHGEAGKQAAAEKASTVLSSLIQEVSDDISLHKHRWPSCMQTNSAQRVVVDTSPPNTDTDATPRTARKTRVSFGGGASGTRRQSIDFMSPPKLKANTASSRTPAAATIGTVGRSTSRGSVGAATPSMRINGQPRPVLTALLGAVQKLATHASLDKVGPRTLTVETLVRCLVALPFLERQHLLKFLIRQCHSKVSTHRLVACEVVGAVLDQSWLWTEHSSSQSSRLSLSRRASTSTTPGTQRKTSSTLAQQSERNMPTALFGALQGRLVDRVSTVRAASFSAITNVLVRLLDNHQKQQAKGGESSSLAISSSIGVAKVLEAEALSLGDCFRRRATVDEKATVRKAAVTALAQLLLVGEFIPAVRLSIAPEDILTLAQRCSDASTLTRKAAAEALTSILQGYATVPDSDDDIMQQLQSTWTASVLPLVMDGETSCNSKAIEFVDRIVLSPILCEKDEDIDNNDDNDDGQSGPCATAWSILASIGSGPGGQGASPCESEALRKALVHRVETSANPKQFVKALVILIQKKASVPLEQLAAVTKGSSSSSSAYLAEEQRAGVWSLFSSLVYASHDIHHLDLANIIKRSKIDLSFLGSSWEVMLHMSSRGDACHKATELLRCSMHHSLEVISVLAPCVDIEITKQTLRRLLELLSTFALPEATIGAAITALTSLTVSSASDAYRPQQRKLCTEWIETIYTACKEEIMSFVDNTTMTNTEEATLLRAIFTVGEVSMVGFNPTDDDADGSNRHDDDKTDNTCDLSKNVRGLHVKPNRQLVELVQTFLATVMPGSNTSVPDSVRAHAFIALGKLCLRDEALAKSSLNVLARELHENMSQGKAASPTVQSNALLVLGDLCVRYTSMTDKYLPAMGACMQSGTTDPDCNLLGTPSKSRFVLVRRHAVILLSNLIMQDYIKWRGLLYFRFLVATTDEDDGVAELAQAALCGPLLEKQPKLFVNQFVASFFVLNRCQAHPMYVAAAATGDGGSGVTVGFEGINLTGQAGHVRRLQMYELMLSKMKDEQKMHVHIGITNEILGGVLIEGSDLNKACVSDHVIV